MPVSDQLPLISIYVITWNRKELLKRALDSIFRQTYQNFEIIVVDNGSSDGTEVMMHDYYSTQCKLSYVRLHDNMGPSYARNVAIRKATGRYVTGMDDDDVWCDNRLATLLATYRKEYAFVYADDLLVKGGKIVGRTKRPKATNWSKIRYEDTVGNQVLSEKYKFVESGLFDEKLCAAEDYDMWLRMIAKFGSAYKCETASQKISVGDYARISSSLRRIFRGNFACYRKHKHLLTTDQRKHRLLVIKHLCRRRMSLRTYVTLFGVSFVKMKLYVFFRRVWLPRRAKGLRSYNVTTK